MDDSSELQLTTLAEAAILAHSEKQNGAVPRTGEQSITDTLAERGARYGDFSDNAYISQTISTCFKSFNGWNRLDPVKAEVLTVIAAKIARILNGDPEYRDNWHDIAGYATLAEERCK